MGHPVCRRGRHLRLPDPRPVEGDHLPEVALPGVHGLTLGEPQARGFAEAGGEAVPN